MGLSSTTAQFYSTPHTAVGPISDLIIPHSEITCKSLLDQVWLPRLTKLIFMWFSCWFSCDSILMFKIIMLSFYKAVAEKVLIRDERKGENIN